MVIGESYFLKVICNVMRSMWWLLMVFEFLFLFWCEGYGGEFYCGLVRVVL